MQITSKIGKISVCKFSWLLLSLLFAQLLYNVYSIALTHPRYIMMPHFLLTRMLELVSGFDTSHSGFQLLDGNTLFLFGKLCSALAGGQTIAAALGMSLYWLALLIVIYFLAADLNDKRAGLLAACLMTLIPFASGMSRNFDVHVPRMLFIALFLLAVLKAKSQGLLRFGLLTGFAIALGLSHAAIPTDCFLFLLGISGAVLSFAYKQRNRVAWLTLTLFGSGVLAAVLCSSGEGLGVTWLFAESANRAYFPPSLVGWLKSLLYYPAALLLEIFGLLAAPVAIIGFYKLIKNRQSLDSNKINLLLFGALLPLLVMILIPKRNLYYLGILVPYLAVLGGVGLSFIKPTKTAGAVLITTLVAAHVSYALAVPPIVPLDKIFAGAYVTNNTMYEADRGMRDEIEETSNLIVNRLAQSYERNDSIHLAILARHMDQQLVAFRVMQAFPQAVFANVLDLPGDAQIDQFACFVVLSFHHNPDEKVSDPPATVESLTMWAGKWATEERLASDNTARILPGLVARFDRENAGDDCLLYFPRR